MSSMTELLDRRGHAWGQMTDILDTAEAEKRELTAEERQTYDKAEAAVSADTTEIDRLKRHADLSKSFDRIDEHEDRSAGGGNGPEARDQSMYDAAFWSYVRRGREGLEPEERALLATGFTQPTKEQRAQGTPTTAGGYTIPQGFRAKIVETLKFFSAMRELAEVVTTDTGNTLPWPTVNDTANVGAILAENTQMTQLDVTFGQAQLGAYMYTSKLILVSWQLLQDSFFDLESFLGRIIGTRLGRIQNTHFTTGTGTAQPLGVQTNAVVGKTGLAGQTLTVIYDDLIDLIHSIDPAYRNQAGGRAKFMLNDLTLAAIRKIKDTQGHPLWVPAVTAGVGDTLLGYGIVPNNDMPTMAANAKSILFGDFMTAYVIRDVLGLQVIRLDERYADFLQSGFFGFMRSDATLQDNAAVKAYSNSAT